MNNDVLDTLELLEEIDDILLSLEENEEKSLKDEDGIDG